MTSLRYSSSVAPTPPANSGPRRERVTGRRVRVVLATVAVLDTGPYLALKIAWLMGSDVGLTSHEMLGDPVMEVANAVTGGMELVAAVTAIVLAGRRAFRVSGAVWHLLGFVATGLLGGILVLLPVQVVLVLAKVSPAPQTAQSAGQTGPIAEWVYSMVYGGFAVLGLSWLALFGLHAAERWRPAGGWSRPLGEVAAPRRLVAGVSPATAAAICGVALIAVTLAELVGYASMGFVGGHPTMAVLMALVAGASLVALAQGRPARLPRWVPVLGGYAGCAAVTCWGVFFTVMVSVPNALVGDQDIPAWLLTTSVLRVVTGALATWTFARLVRNRPADLRPVGRIDGVSG